MANAKRSWKQEENTYLEEHWGTFSIPTIAKNLGRSVNSIKNKAFRLGLGPYLLGGEYVSLNQLMIALTGHAVSSYQSISWVKNRNLPVHTKRVNKNSFRVVYLEEFWEWAEKNKSFIDFSKMEPLALGIEPDWVAEQRRKDYRSCSLQKKDPWSPIEDQNLLSLLQKQQYGYKELSELLHRSAGAIQRRCIDLGTKYRPVKSDSHSPENVWTDNDFRILAQGIKNGDSYTLIGNTIGKSEKAVRGKVYFTYLTERADKVRAMLGDGDWGNGAPVPSVKQAINLSNRRASVKRDLSVLACILKYRMNELGYDPYFQRFMCVRWDDFKGCTSGCTNCDSCTEFIRIKPQFCTRCGGSFYERKENKLCRDCRAARKKQAQKKWCILTKRRSGIAI